MIDTSFKIVDRLVLQQATFLTEVFDHWREIRADARFPDKRAFRPQKFPKFLSHIAMVAVVQSEGQPPSYEDRLTGDMIIDVLRLRQNNDRLASARDLGVRDVVHGMLDATLRAGTAMYFRGQLQPERANPVDFSALLLPFCQSETAGGLDTILLAFDFSKHALDEPLPLEKTVI